MSKFKFTEEHVPLLGVLSDYELARQIGVRPATITYHRMRLTEWVVQRVERDS